jgi:hypothetical protein
MKINIALSLMFALIAFRSYAEELPKKETYRLTEEERKVLDQGEISDGQRAFGGILGTTVGFGLGHLAMGEYAEAGWMYTVGEALGVGTFLFGTSQISNCWLSDNYNCQEKPRIIKGPLVGAFILTGLVMFSAAKLTEIFDVWSRPAAHNRQYNHLKQKMAADKSFTQVGFYVLPPVGLANIPAAAGLQLSF